jgi:hypothetical protein
MCCWTSGGRAASSGAHAARADGERDHSMHAPRRGSVDPDAAARPGSSRGVGASSAAAALASVCLSRQCRPGRARAERGRPRRRARAPGLRRAGPAAPPSSRTSPTAPPPSSTLSTALRATGAADASARPRRASPGPQRASGHADAVTIAPAPRRDPRRLGGPPADRRRIRPPSPRGRPALGAAGRLPGAAAELAADHELGPQGLPGSRSAAEQAADGRERSSDDPDGEAATLSKHDNGAARPPKATGDRPRDRAIPHVEC